MVEIGGPRNCCWYVGAAESATLPCCTASKDTAEHWTAVKGAAQQAGRPPTIGRERNNAPTEMVSSRIIAVICGLELLQRASAWHPSPLRVPIHTRTAGQRRAVRDIVAGEHHSVRQQWSALRSVADGEGVGGAGRPDLASMKRAFEGTMDNKLVMEYVMVRV